MVTGMLASSSACIIPDECIVVTSNGTDWCSNAVGALMWPAGHPELAQPVLLDRKPATGCRCFNSAENEIMWAELPADTFEEFKLECEELYGEGETGSIDETDGRDSDGVDGVNRAVTSSQGDV